MLSVRQEKLLAAIIEEYAEVASPVGSSLLAKLFGVSSATIRAEMAELERQGFNKQPHTSAGRIPTDKGYRHYVNVVQDQKETAPSKREQRTLSARVSGTGANEQTIRNAVETLVD